MFLLVIGDLQFAIENQCNYKLQIANYKSFL